MANKTLSVFIDESGDFGAYERHSPYYIVSLVFHDQAVDINQNLSVFSSHFPNVEFRKVQPVDYRLFQVADMICTMEMLAEKMAQKSFSASELEFFDTMRAFKKNYWKWIKKKRL